MSNKVFCVINPNLKNGLGHYLEYVKSLDEAVASRGYKLTVLVNRSADNCVTSQVPAIKVFRREIWHVTSWIAQIPRIGRRLNTFIENIRWYITFSFVLNRRRVNRDWVIFFDMVCHNQLFACAWWFRALPARRRPRLVLLFRYSTDWFDYWAGDSMTRRGFAALSAADREGRLRLCSDSARLANDYSRFTSRSFEIFPIPHTTHPVASEPPQRCEGISKLRFVSLGGARDEKGFLEILQAILLLHRLDRLGDFEFVLQATGYPPNAECLIKEIEATCSSAVRFVFETMPSHEYYAILRDADIVLAPYWRSIYVSRTSGILAEAIAVGKVVVVTENTWMSDQLQSYGGGLACRDRDPQDLVRAILEIEKNFTQLAARARTTRGEWISTHSPNSLISRVFSEESGTKEKDPMRSVANGLSEAAEEIRRTRASA